ncbi:MAG: ABC transporter ATP-binding protein [Anaerolineae bacterium]|nr:ABC transporter ATP-binding protein [Anaerolineae bacterium]
MTVISVENVSKRFALGHGASILAVDDLSLNVNEGDALAIVGPSGCGKTTLLRMIAGLEQPDSGIVRYDGILIDNTAHRERGIGMVFQDYALIPQWESKRTIGFFLRLRNREREVPERVRRVSHITGVGIEQLMDKFPRQLSGGEKQRVAIARAFARDLKLLLFDEPFANLDAKFRSNARIEARKLLNEFNTTTIYVTHDQLEAATMANKIIVMRSGRVEQMGAYQDVFNDPDTMFAGQFVGVPTMNLFEGEVWQGHWQGENFGPFPIHNPDIADESQVIMGIRPQDIHLGGAVAGVVDSITPFFAERYQLLNVWLAGEEWSVQVSLDDTFTIGKTYQFRADINKLYFFDATTGLRIRKQ